MNKTTQFKYDNVQEQFDLWLRDIARHNEEKEFDLFVNMKTYMEMSCIPTIQYRGSSDVNGVPEHQRLGDYYYGRYFYKHYIFNLYIIAPTT